ncbi:non-ribosomal peptide synthetase [Tsukamurella sp. 1534]|uniref:non-ribosomal peptide synthetase n=1 Tax=Tsukamurella sp. 1534 TaxID=1151061 RepID=UPI00030378E7|nr:non-ribosomal peptide synthetase [Tsukamurella sp. 1534]
MALAIIGAAVRLSGCNTLGDFWDSLCAGRVGTETIPDREALADGASAADVADPRYVPVGTRIGDAGAIDLDRFRLTRGEAELIDPQHRLILKLAAEALQSSGLDPAEAVVGTFGSVSAPTYLLRRVAPRLRDSGAAIPYPALLGSDPAFAAARVARKLGLTGPALAVQSACSSSLMAVHQAASALAQGDIDAAIVVAASLAVPGASGYIASAGDVLSPSGRCRPFDARADGVVPGQGGAAVVLTRLSRAAEHGSDVLAVIAGTAANNDGAAAGSFTHPHPDGQASVQVAAMARSGVDPGRIRYVETHGTGTALGDPIEVRGLHLAHGAGPECLLGAVKANFGHLDAAAGVTGLLKAAMVLRHGIVPAQPDFGDAHPELGLHRTRFRVADAASTLPDGAAVAVSSFGMGGGNVSAVLVPAPPRPAAPTTHGGTVEVRASSDAALRAYRSRLAEAVRGRTDISVADVARSLRQRAESGDRTVALHAATIPGLVRALEAPGEAPSGPAGPRSGDAGRFVLLPPAPFDETWVDLPPIVETPPAPDAVPAPSSSSSPESVHDTVRAAFASALGAEVGADLLASDFMDAGGESVMLVELVAELEAGYGCRIDFDALDAVATVGEMVDVLAAQIDGAASPERVTLVRYGDWSRPGPRWLLHPPAGGTTLVYRRLAHDLGDAPIGVFTAPAGERTIPQIAADALAAIPADVRGPLWLGGYSFGGNVAMAMALLAEDAGRPVAHVALVDALSPASYPVPAQPLGSAAYRAAADRVLRRFADVPDGRAPEFAERWSRHHRALMEHRPVGRITAPVTVFRATEHDPSGVFAALGVRPAHDWTPHTAGPVAVVDVPGDHYSILADDEHRAALLRRWRAALPDDRPDAVRPPSPAQARIAAAQFARPSDPGANIGAVMEFTGLDPRRLAAAIEAVATATGAVNDTVSRAAGELVRVPHPGARPGVPVVPYADLDAVLAAAEAVYDAVFPPHVWPQFHLEVAVCGPRTFAVLVTSHLVTDVFGWYLMVLDIAGAYRDGEAWEPPPDVAPHALATGGVNAEEAVAHFRATLPTTPDAPSWARRAGNAPLAGSASSATVDGARVVAASRELGVRTFSFLLAAHAVTTGLLGAGPIVVVSVPLSNRRSTADAANHRGVLVNSLPVSVDLSAPGRTFADLARDVDGQVAALIGFESFDLLRYADRIPGAAAAAGAPSSFTVYPRPLAPSIGGVTAVTHVLRRRHVQFPLSVVVECSGTELAVRVEQCDALRGTDVGAVYASVLRSAADAPGAALASIGWSHPAVPGPPAADRPPARAAAATTLVDLFRAVVRGSPRAVAVATPNATLDYAELDRRARTVANGIAARIDGPFVGVAIPPSAELVVAMVAVLYASRTYVPIDVETPRDRVLSMVADVGGMDVITAGAAPWPDSPGLHHHPIEELTGEGTAPSAPAPGDTAYVIFTSGSTGRPKAVPITHGSITALFDATRTARVPGGRWPLFHSPAFDFSVWEVFGALLDGGTVLIPPHRLRRDPAGYLAWLRAERADVVCLTPSALGMLNAAATDDDWSSVSPRVVFLGGERLRPATVRRILSASPRTRVFNLYGPTEAAILTTMAEIDLATAESDPEAVIGIPLPHTGAAVVDSAGRTVPPGVTGELLVYGPHVTSGYLGHAAADRAAFAPITRNGRTYAGYRTGDLVYRRPDGDLVYVGRGDDQVQVRGHRVEPGEVEAALAADTRVAEVAVVAVGEDLDRRLVAFVVLTDGTHDVDAIAGRLHSRLPAHLRPARVLAIDAIPTGPSGKADRNLLARRAEDDGASYAAVPDRPSIARAVDEFWAEALGTRIGSDESFFEAGGTSIQVVELVETIRSTFDLDELTATDVFAHPTRTRLVDHLCRS